MKYCKFTVHLMLLFTVPFTLFSPQDALAQIAFQEQKDNLEINQTKKSQALSYDEIIHLLEELESGELEKKCTLEDLEKINCFFISLAKQGVLPNNLEAIFCLEEDIGELLNDERYRYALHLGTSEYRLAPLILKDFENFVFCKSWIEKQWDQTKKFVKKHKTAIIVGTIIVVTVTVVVAAVVISSAAATGVVVEGVAGTVGAAGTIAFSDSPSMLEKPNYTLLPDIPSGMEAVQKTPHLQDAIGEQIFSFKDSLVKEPFFCNHSILYPELSIEENGRTLGSIFAHESLKNLKQQIPNHPKLAHEIQQINSNYSFSSLINNKGNSDLGHLEIDKRFSTDYTCFYTPDFDTDFTAISYQARGEKALACGYYHQAIQDLGKAIETNPLNPTPYLERGIAHFKLGQYDHSLEDYHQFSSQIQKKQPLLVSDFSLGFARGLPQGIYDSGSGLFLFLSDLVKHPLNTGTQMWDALTLLTNLVKSEEWSILTEMLTPEIHQLVTEWDMLSSDKRGELAGYAFGKYGSDILIPGALAKATSKGLKGARELGTIYKGLQITEQTLLLETIAGVENTAKIGEIIQLEKQVSNWLGDGTQFMRNKAGDPIFISKDGVRKVRFDFNRPAPHENPHLHFEQLIEGEWNEISRIYPCDVPHK